MAVKRTQLSKKAQAKKAAKQNAKLRMPKKLKNKTSEEIEFDGELAQAWLDQDAKVREATGHKNRKLTRSNVVKKAEAMEAGEWACTSQGITVDSNGAVIDGQHTLNAIVMYYQKSDEPQPVRLYVTEGEDPDNFPFYDQGKARTGADVFEMEGKEDPKELAKAARLVWIRAHGRRIAGSPGLSPYKLMKFIEDHPGLSDSIRFVKEFGRSDDQSDFCKSLMPEGQAAALHYLMCNADMEGAKASGKDLADQFFDLAINPERKSKLAPCRLRQKFNKVKNDPDVRMTKDAVVDWAIECFNRFVDDNTDPIKLDASDRPQLGGIDGSLAPESEED